MTGHVFISHGSEDSEEANALAAFIEAKGVRAWIAPRDVRPGQDYSEQLQEAIETCTSFVVLVTDKANRSPYVRAETEMAFSTSKPIFPVRMSEIKPAAGLAFFLKIRHWTDAFGGGREASLARLARELQTHAGVPVDDAPLSTIPPAGSVATVPPTPAPAPSPPAPPTPAPSPPTAPPSTSPGFAPAAPVGLMTKPAPIDESLLLAAIGPNSAYYLDRWRKIDETGSAISWNWPACLANIFWFAYRKMWLPLIVMLVALIGLSAVGAANPDLGKPTLVLSILLSFVTGAFGNLLYRKQIHRLIADTSALDRAAQVEAIAERGGVSKPAVYVLVGLVVVLTLLSLLAAAKQISDGLPVTPVPAPENGFTPLPPNPYENPPSTNPGVDGEKPPLTEEEERSLQQGF